MAGSSTARSDRWLRLVTSALGPQALPIPPDALGYLEAFLQWMDPPHRSAMALVVANAIGLHASRYGWAEVRRTLLDDPSVEIPHRGSFPWVVQTMIIGANELPSEMINSEPMQLALQRLFAGSDLVELAGFCIRWKRFVVTAGASMGTEESLPFVIGDKTLMDGAVAASEINSRERAESLDMADLWASVAARTCLAFHLEGENGTMPITFHRSPDGNWSMRRIDALIDVELHAAARELLSRIVRTLEKEPNLDAPFKEAARRRARYGPDSCFYVNLSAATEAELAEVAGWFPVGAQGPVEALQRAWQSRATFERGLAHDST